MSRISWVCSECGRSNSPDLATCICTGSSEKGEKRDAKEDVKERIQEEVTSRLPAPIRGILGVASNFIPGLKAAKIALPIVGLLGGGLLAWNLLFKSGPPLPDFTKEIAELEETITEKTEKIAELVEELANTPIPEAPPPKIVRVRVPITDTVAVKEQLTALRDRVDFYEEQYPIAINRMNLAISLSDSLLSVVEMHERKDVFQDKQLETYRASLGKTRRELWVTRAVTVGLAACIAYNENVLGIKGDNGKLASIGDASFKLMSVSF